MGEKICVFGAGAIGGFLAARLAHAGHSVSCVARGAQRKAIAEHGLTLIENDGEIKLELHCTNSSAELGVQDVVFLTLKSQSLADSLAGITALLGSDTMVVTVQNGLPWWYFHQDGSGFPTTHLESVDPGGGIWAAIGAHRALGAVVYPAAEIVSPGVVRHVFGDRFALGEPHGGRTHRTETLSELLGSAGFNAQVSSSIRDEIWLKLCVNAALNPLSVIRQSTIGVILADGEARAWLETLMAEAQAVSNALGVKPLMAPAEMVESLRVVSQHKTSMLKDFENGRPLELDGLTGAVLEIAGTLNVPTPGLAQVYQEVQLAAA